MDIKELLKLTEEYDTNEDIISLVEKARPAFMEIMQKAGDITKEFDGTEIYDVARVVQLTIENYLEGLGDKIFKDHSQYAQAKGRVEEV